MGRYDRSYDFGMRGYRQTTRPLGDDYRRPPPYDRGYGLSYPDDRYGYPYPSRRVTARYNRDYVEGYRHPDERRTFGFRGGDMPGRIGDETMYRRPYMTIGGSRTMRGSQPPPPDPRGRPGPRYGGRFRDEF